MEQLRIELEAAGHDVQFVAINKSDAAGDQAKLAKTCSFPLLQDVANVSVWSIHHQGRKDDIYVYGADGTLGDFLPINGDRETNLSTDEGYKNLKDAILDVLADAQ